MAQAINHRQRNDCTILAQNRVREQCAKERREVNPSGELMIMLGRRGAGHSDAFGRGHPMQILRHEDNQNAFHAVETEPLGRFIPDDVGNALG